MFANPKTFCIFDYLAIFIKDQSHVAVTGYDWDEKIEYFNEKSRRWWLVSKDLLEKFDFFLFLVWSKFLLSWGRNYNKATHHPPISCRATFIVFNSRMVLKQQVYTLGRVVDSDDVSSLFETLRTTWAARPSWPWWIQYLIKWRADSNQELQELQRVWIQSISLWFYFEVQEGTFSTAQRRLSSRRNWIWPPRRYLVPLAPVWCLYRKTITLWRDSWHDITSSLSSLEDCRQSFSKTDDWFTGIVWLRILFNMGYSKTNLFQRKY